ncbi:hypothetical protein HEAFMP_HEAFMP_06535, partial [Dysosmobacter welbionis]
HHHHASGHGDPRQDAAEEEPDEDHGGPRHPLCGPDHVHRKLQGHHGEGPQGHLHPRRGVLERDGALPPRLAVSQREADGGHQDGGGDLRVAA